MTFNILIVMQLAFNNKGFSLIELIVIAVIINILAGVALVAYIGAKEKTRVSYIIRTASSASADLHLWLNSSFSHNRDLRELDTNLDGEINDLDMTNGELFLYGVAKAYREVRNSVLKETSPWFNRPLWNSDDPPTPGTISLTQPSTNQLKIVAKEKNGMTVYEEVIFAN